MSEYDSLSHEQQRELDEVIVGYLLAVESGAAPDREELLAQHPDLGDHLRSFFFAHDHGPAGNADERIDAGPPARAALGEAPTLPLAAEANTLPPAGVETKTRGTTEVGSSPRAERFGDYELIEEIARGGMGVVYKARHTKLNRIVALKMILSGTEADADEIRRFLVEAEAAANLDHPRIVPIYEVGQHEGRHFFSMGYVEGQSLARRLSDGPLPPRAAAELLGMIAEAVHYAHQQGIVHRDLKPANILLDGSGEPRVTDFGLAKRVQGDSELTQTGQILGTPSFMPPEQALGRLSDIGPASDVYALGAILYALLTGQPPFARRVCRKR